MSLLIPDFIFENIYCLTPEFLLSEGVFAVILDIDNTLVTYDDPLPTESVSEWLCELEKAGISAAFVSNNSHSRVELFNSELGFFASAKSKKPFAAKLHAAMKHMGCDKSHTLMVGDQIFTDVLAGKAAGIRTVLVPPIKDRTDLFTKFKRLLERPAVAAFERRKNK